MIGPVFQDFHFFIQYLYNGGKQENLSEANKQCPMDLFFKSLMFKLHSTFSYMYKHKSKEDEHRGRAAVQRDMQLIALNGFSVFKYFSEFKLVEHFQIVNEVPLSVALDTK